MQGLTGSLPVSTVAACSLTLTLEVCEEQMRQVLVARDCVLEFDADAAARGISDGLSGLVADVIAPRAATGRRKGRGRCTGKAF